MKTRKIFKLGNCAAITLPSEICKNMGITIGDIVELDTVEGSITITPQVILENVPEETAALLGITKAEGENQEQRKKKGSLVENLIKKALEEYGGDYT